MYRSFRAGDLCPECTCPLERHTPSAWALFRRRPFLKCSNCGLVIRRRPASQRNIQHQSSDWLGIAAGENTGNHSHVQERAVETEHTCEVGTKAPIRAGSKLCAHCGQTLDRCSFHQFLRREMSDAQ
jgi:hypothetical protein